jgi:hypothetical protein
MHNGVALTDSKKGTKLNQKIWCSPAGGLCFSDFWHTIHPKLVGQYSIFFFLCQKIGNGKS